MKPSLKLRNGAGKGASWLLKLVWTLLIVVPFVQIILLSLRSMASIYNDPLGFSGDWVPQNFPDAWAGPSGTAGFGLYARNSVLVAAVALAVSTAFGSLAAYFTATLPPKWRRRAMLVPLIATTVPTIALLIPFFQAFNILGTLNSPSAVGVLYGLLCLPTTVLVLHAFFLDFPEDIREAAAMDGLGHIGTFLRMVLPLSTGPLGAVGLLNLIWVWGETQIGLVLLHSSNAQTIPLGLLSFQGRFVSNLGPMFAGLAMATVPIIVVYIVFHRSINKGISLGGFR
ncbi:carbohydrate ABC transporter permease [Dactylosporangium sucinum]|uniref:ABC transporter permease n=1 Tax=Dactylosporangium sucinum TaxID=1424081 RepID=A0A917SYN1_9ACTN|nr:carbohydrate ABC transporter permease [Dactylosporangium sucinum]GGM04054.1 ABC transporter permease [Dactylosporangium sucinum]